MGGGSPLVCVQCHNARCERMKRGSSGWLTQPPRQTFKTGEVWQPQVG
jgi:hypothetical protein